MAHVLVFSFSFSGISFLTHLSGRISVPIHSESLFTKGCLKELEFTEGRETWSLKAGLCFDLKQSEIEQN